ncbi:hypothetical protein RJ641_010672 [Dillenia turbinata]|uniref:Uncharacterized protein n=1 Tax=Dillenia turbinata TaxID=194707 RepID=A0AAN8V804_9MAGN
MHSLITKPFITAHFHGFPTRTDRRLRATPIKSNTATGGGSSDDKEGNTQPPPPPTITPPDTVEVRFRRGSRRRRMREQQELGGSGVQSAKATTPAPPKDWDSMTTGEKVMELYAGEKGLLFWLNKLAYASIFIVIGGWIVFRFVGPSLNLYQLDTPPLSPTSMFK